jgi:hypothetical protein
MADPLISRVITALAQHVGTTTRHMDKARAGVYPPRQRELEVVPDDRPDPPQITRPAPLSTPGQGRRFIDQKSRAAGERDDD